MFSMNSENRFLHFNAFQATYIYIKNQTKAKNK